MEHYLQGHTCILILTEDSEPLKGAIPSLLVTKHQAQFTCCYTSPLTPKLAEEAGTHPTMKAYLTFKPWGVLWILSRTLQSDTGYVWTLLEGL